MNIHHEEKIRASIDIGSNSVLLLIGYWKGDQFICLDQDAHITGLGRGIREQQAFDHLSQQETMNVLMLYKEKILKHNLKVDEVIVVATEASRVAKNADLFFHQVKLNTGFTVYTISSEGESYYSALGVSLGLSSFLKSSQKNLPSDIFLIDLGGGSTEFSLFSRQPFAHKYQISFPFGCVRFDHQTSYKEISLAVEKEFKKLET
jgi:exopolyphosphatase/guanosine-5'-triphosphate,3'-diphosphate pyrophosphatase